MQSTSSERANLTNWLPEVLAGLMELDYAVPAFELVDLSRRIDSIATPELRQIYQSLRAQGYIGRAISVAEELDRREEATSGHHSRQIKAEFATLSGEVDLSIPSLSSSYQARPGRVLQVVGSSLPDMETNYALATHTLAKLGPKLGVDISVATQMGYGNSTAYSVEVIDDISYHRIPGPGKGSVPFDNWIKLYAKRLSAVVRKIRPAVIIAASDFFNGLAAQAVCAEYKIPFIYDVRGLWEDSWLARNRKKYSWTLDQVPGRWGFPEVWSLRRDRELDLINNATDVVVRGDRLGERILDLGVGAEQFNVAGTNADSFEAWADLFVRIGVLTTDRAKLLKTGITSNSLVETVLANERLPLGNIATYGGWGDPEAIRTEGWRHGSLEPIIIDLPFDWMSAGQEHRSQAFKLHAWDFMVPFFRDWETNKEERSLVWCLERAVDWASNFNDGADHGTMAWYDMAIGLRAPRLAYLVQEAIHEGIASADVEVLTRSVECHQRAIHTDSAFNVNTNHGFYTAVGQLSFSNRLRGIAGMDVVERQGEERLRQVAISQFASDGGHLEHSPDYHRMLLSSFLGAMEDGILSDPEVADRIEKAREVMSWFLRPDRTVVQIGDSPKRLSALGDRAMSSAHTSFLVSKGKNGEPNSQELLMLRESGYAVVRSPQPVGKTDHDSASYLTFMAGFHSRAHKHCDDLSVTWFDGGQEILIDSGRYGYLDPLPADSAEREQGFFYARKERQYVERVCAHNTVQADGREHDRRHRAPYGSALVSGSQGDGQFVIVGEVDHGSWTHLRRICLKPGAWLLVKDELVAKDEKGHDFTVWWNLSEEFTATVIEGGSVMMNTETGRPIYVTPLRESELVVPVCGQLDPLRGWRSTTDYEFTPSWSLGYKVENRAQHTFMTLFSLDEVPKLPSQI